MFVLTEVDRFKRSLGQTRSEFFTGVPRHRAVKYVELVLLVFFCKKNCFLFLVINFLRLGAVEITQLNN